MDDAGCGNEFVRRIAMEVETGGGDGDSEVDRPYPHAVQGTDHFTVVEVESHPAKLNQFGQFPEYDGGNGPYVCLVWN